MSLPGSVVAVAKAASHGFSKAQLSNTARALRAGGVVSTGDAITAELPELPHLPLERV